MTKKYYVYNMFWGYFMSACIFYFSYGNNNPKIIALQILALTSGILFPFARFFIEKIALKYTDKKYWETGFFRDGVPKTYLISMYNIICFFASIPLGIACLFFELKKGCYDK